MKIDNIQPLKKYLHIFQLEEYKPLRLLKWIFRKKEKINLTKKEMVFTTKAKFLYYTTLVLYIIFTVIVYIIFDIFLTIAYIIVFWQAIFVFLILSFYILKIYEIPNRALTKKRIKQKLLQNNKLKTISITGSAGKTTTKKILARLLVGKVLATPKSFNTLFGIAKVIDYEMDDRYDYFICEMGAYKRGEIKELMQTIPTNVSILTTINKQHIERFKSIKNTIKAKFEILQNIKENGVGIVNLDNKHILQNLNSTNVKLYGFTNDLESLKQSRFSKTLNLVSEIISVKNIQIKKDKTHFTLSYQNKNYDFVTNLLGEHHTKNIAAALTAAIALGEEVKNLQKKVAKIEQIPHRLEHKQKDGVHILDDTYSSNEEGFKKALKVLKYVGKGKKILVTPGLVELGSETKSVHISLGEKIAKEIDTVILVGKNQRTKALEAGVKNVKEKHLDIVYVNSHLDAQEKITQIATLGDTVLFENDLPDQYL